MATSTSPSPLPAAKLLSKLAAMTTAGASSSCNSRTSGPMAPAFATAT